jgi:MFS family permease
MDLGASYTLLGFIVSIYGAVQLLTQIPIGRLSDRIGRKRILLLGLATFTFMPLLYIYASSAYLLLLIRAMGGVGAAAVWPLAMALIVDQTRAEGRGAALGWYNASFFSALAFGPLFGGVLYDHFGMNAPFYFWAFLGAMAVVIVHLRVMEPEKVEIGVLPERGENRLINQGYLLTFLACCSVVLWVGVVGGFNYTMLPDYAAGLGLSATDVGLIYMAYGGDGPLEHLLRPSGGSRKKKSPHLRGMPCRSLSLHPPAQSLRPPGGRPALRCYGSWSRCGKSCSGFPHCRHYLPHTPRRDIRHLQHRADVGRRSGAAHRRSDC